MDPTLGGAPDLAPVEVEEEGRPMPAATKGLIAAMALLAVSQVVRLAASDTVLPWPVLFAATVVFLGVFLAGFHLGRHRKAAKLVRGALAVTPGGTAVAGQLSAEGYATLQGFGRTTTGLASYGGSIVALVADAHGITLWRRRRRRDEPIARFPWAETRLVRGRTHSGAVRTNALVVTTADRRPGAPRVPVITQVGLGFPRPDRVDDAVRELRRALPRR